MSQTFFERTTESIFPVGAKITGFIFMIIGFVAILGAPIIGIPVFLMGGFVCFAKTGISIDFEKKLIKNQWGVFGLKFGSWSKLPDLKMISVTPFTQRYSNNLQMGGAQSYSKETSFRVNLKGMNQRISIVASNGNREKALRDAEELADRLKLDLLDCTGPEKKLIKIASA